MLPFRLLLGQEQVLSGFEFKIKFRLGFPLFRTILGQYFKGATGEDLTCPDDRDSRSEERKQQT